MTPDEHSRLPTAQMQALDHPVRLGIIGLFTKDRGRSLAAADLRAALIAEDPAEFGKYATSQVSYHRARLQDAQLLPTR